ncbi:MAG TPA: hypothetical protein VFU72_06745 [Nitrolancea sp.]|nr:hypothetical protein [Nitrolancea sp.]
MDESLKNKAKETASDLIEDASTEITEQAEELKDKAGKLFSKLQDKLEDLTGGDDDKAKEKPA